MKMRRQRGFTLVEMIIVIVITGIIAGMVAMFLRAPVQGYVDSERRAELTDLADTALRRIARDLRAAVPNSVRVSAPTYIEFLPTRDGGRYRVNDAGGMLCGVAGDELDFDLPPDSCFAIVGSQMDIAEGDAIIVGSAQSDGNPPYLAPGNANSVRRMVPAAGAGAARTTVVITPSAVPFPASYEGYRFEVVPADQQAVTYACEDVNTVNGTGTGVLRRYWHYGFNAIQAAPPFAAGSSAILAERVSACSFIYNTSNARNSLVAMQLTLTRDNESVTLYHEVHINNIP